MLTLFHSNVSFLYSLKTLENLWYWDFFRVNRNRILEWQNKLFCWKSVYKNFEKCRGKHLCQGISFNKKEIIFLSLLKKRSFPSCFPLNFAKCLGKPISKNPCVKRIRIRSYSGPDFSRIFPHSDWIRRDSPYLSVFSSNAGKCWKNADQNNSKYGHFLRSEYFWVCRLWSEIDQRYSHAIYIITNIWSFQHK